MNKEITIAFKGQSKAMVEEVKIKWILTEEEVGSKKFINDDLLEEVRVLTEKASDYAKHKTLHR